MTERPRRGDKNQAMVPPEPGALGLPAVPAGQPAPRRAARLMRTLRTRWWPRFLLAGILLVVVGVTVLGGVAQAVVAGLGALIVFVIALRPLSMSPGQYRREPPHPPGSSSAGGS
jgi:hypothetical protein